MSTKLENFLAKFPDNATSWADATDEIRDMYVWLSDSGSRFPPVGRENCKTPAEWNQKYKAAIKHAYANVSEQLQQAFKERFTEWLNSLPKW